MEVFAIVYPRMHAVLLSLAVRATLSVPMDAGHL